MRRCPSEQKPVGTFLRVKSLPWESVDMNATLIVLLSSLLIGTSFLSEVPDDKSKSEPNSYLSNHPLLTGAAAVRAGPGCDNRRGQYAEEDEEEDTDRPPFGGKPQRRRYPNDDYDLDNNECFVRFGLHYSSCFSKSKDFDDKFDQLQQHVQSWPRGTAGRGSASPCGTLQLLAKVKSSPLFERCQGNQYVVRAPYQMYNVKGEMRYIVQDPSNLEQCYLEAQCSIPGDLCRGYGIGYPRRGGASTSRCESRHCHHTLLAWDPEVPDAGTFFDVFEYACCCNCQVASRNVG